MSRYLLLTLIFCVSVGNLFSRDVYDHVRQDSGTQNLELEISYILDPSDTLSLNDIESALIKERFDESPLTIPNLGYTPHTHWFHITITGDLQNEIYKLELGHPILQFISLYQKDVHGQWQESKGGHGYSADLKEIWL